MSNKRVGIGICVICKEFTDDPDYLTCGNPQCDKELREELHCRKELLELLEVDSLVRVLKKIEWIIEKVELVNVELARASDLRGIVDEIKKIIGTE